MAEIALTLGKRRANESKLEARDGLGKSQAGPVDGFADRQCVVGVRHALERFEHGSGGHSSTCMPETQTHDEVAQLAHIAGKRVGRDERTGFGGQHEGGKVLAVFRAEMGDEQLLVSVARTQWWYGQHQHAQPVIQVRTERAAGDGVPEVPMGCGQYPGRSESRP